MQGTPHRLFIEWATVVDDVRHRGVAGALIASASVALLVAVAPAVPANPDRSPAAGASFARQLYVGHRDSPFVARFAIDRAGRLALRQRVPSGAGPIGMAFAPDGRTAYVADAFAGAIAAYRVAPRGGLTELRPRVRKGVRAPSGLAVTPDGRRLYVADQDVSRLLAFSIGGRGRLSPIGHPVPSGSLLPREVAVSPDGRLLFASHWSTAAGRRAVVSVFGIRRDGTLRPRGRTRVGVDAAAMSASPDGRFLYVDAQTSGRVHGFRITATGGLRALPGSPYAAGRQAEGVAITPDGRHLYVSNVTRTGRVWAFRVGQRGRLTRLAGSPFGTGSNGPEGMAVTPDGRHLFTANSGSHDVTAFEIGGAGSLTILGSFATGGRTPAAFRGVVVLPDQGPVAAVSARVGGVGHASRFDASASSDSDGRVVRYDWDFGDGTGSRDAGAEVRHEYARAGRFPVTVTVRDDEGCGARLVFTGQTALCNGSAAARARVMITVAGARP